MSHRSVVWALTAVVLFGCSDDNGPNTADGSLTPDAAVADNGAPDAVVSDVAVADMPPLDTWSAKPDVYVNPSPSLGKLTLMVNLGDSIAEGYGVKRGYGYAELIHRNADADYPTYKGKDLTTRFPGISVTDRSRGGSQSTNLPGQVSGVPANTTGDTLVLLSIGGNDVMYKITAMLDAKIMADLVTTITGNIKKVVDHFADKKRYPGKTTFVMLNLYDFTDGMGTVPQDAPTDKYCGAFKYLSDFAGPKVAQSFVTYNNAMAAFAQKQGILLVDIYSHFLGHGFHCKNPASKYYDAADPTLWYRPECIHPNTVGHNEIRKLVWKALGL